MKKIFFSLFILVTIIFLNAFSVSASVLVGASCTVTAKIIDKGVEKRPAAYGPGGEVSREYEYKFLKVKILTTKRVGVFGDCGFVNKGDIFSIGVAEHFDFVNIGDTIKAGLEEGSTMTPSGVVSFIHWEPPITLINSQSSDEPEETEDKPFGQNGLVIILVVIIILVIGGAVYLFSRQRKT